MEVERDRLRKVFPNLAEEMDVGEQKIKINSIRSATENAEKKASAQSNLANYDPDVIDFLRRCDNKQQAEEIISYMENRREITHNYAKKLRQQLLSKGVRSFGAKKEEGYYLRSSKTQLPLRTCKTILKRKVNKDNP